MDQVLRRKVAVGAAAAIAVVGAGAVAGAAVGAGPLSGGTETTSFESSTSTPSAPAGGVSIPEDESQTFDAGGAGFVTVTRRGDALNVSAVSPSAGWTFSIEAGDGAREAEVDFTNGAARVRFNAELEDGGVRVRVRTEGSATTDTSFPDGTTPDTLTEDTTPGTLTEGTTPGTLTEGTTPGTVDDHGGQDSSGPGSGSSGHGSGHSGSGSGGDDDHSGSGGGGGGDHSGSGGGGGDSSGPGGGGD